MAKAAEGKGRCACCGEVIVWRKNDAGTLSYFCQNCDFQGYAKAGTLANRLALEEVEKFKAVSEQTEAAPAARPSQPATPDKPRANGLLMG